MSTGEAVGMIAALALAVLVIASFARARHKEADRQVPDSQASGPVPPPPEPGSVDWGSRSAHVRSVLFKEAVRGYHVKTVDNALDRVANALDRGEQIDPKWIDTTRFPISFRGYSRTEVDSFLNQLRATQ
jgi:DivIVA domain-containing protein